MLQLQAADVLVLAEIAAQRSQNQEEREEIKERLIRGFEKYGNLKLVEYFNNNRERMIRDRSDWLLENLDKAGQTSEGAFASEKGRNTIIRILIQLNVPQRSLEDLADEIIAKFWRHKHAEKYNPLRAPWGHHVRNAVRTCVASYWSSRSRNPDEIGLSIDQMRPQSSGTSDEMNMEPYERDQTSNNPLNLAVLGEFIAEFEQFLREEKPFRTALFHGYREECLLLSPGTPELPTESSLRLFVRAKGRNAYRVVHPEWTDSKSVMVPVSSLQIFEIPGKGGILSKGTAIPNKDFSEDTGAVRIERTPFDVYNLLIRGFQVTEIARELNVGDSTAHNWVRRLEELFAEYWTMCDVIPEETRKLGEPCKKCPKCKGFTIDGNTCENQVLDNFCGTDLQNVKKEIHRMKVFPWDSVRGNPDIKERAAKYKTGMTTQFCNM